MFLLPALGAGISDSFILYLHFTRNVNTTTTTTYHVPAVDPDGNFTNDCFRKNADCWQNVPVKELANELKQDIESVFDTADWNNAQILYKDLDSNTIIYPQDLLDTKDRIHDHHRISTTSHAPQPPSNNDNNPSKLQITAQSIESHTFYLTILAILRLLFLALPFSYAAYSGNRVSYIGFHILHTSFSGLFVLGHMMAVIIVNPTMMEERGDTVNPLQDGIISGLDPVVTEDTNNLFHYCWSMLSFSLISIVLHGFILLHVRSTAPKKEDWYDVVRRRKKMAYAMAKRGVVRSFHGGGSADEEEDGAMSIREGEEEGADETPLLLLSNEGGGMIPHDKNLSNNSKRSTTSDPWRERLRNLPEQYEAFVSEAHIRLNEARRIWMSRLEAVSRGQQERDVVDIDREEPQAVAVVSSTPTNLLSVATKEFQKLGRPDPFRVLLQLFAYEDVWTNHRLDLAFSCQSTSNIITTATSGDVTSYERRAALSFYAPQLLSFLLHGAYLDISHRLEEWILKQCSEDLHFAHRCFWFLRAWCLGSRKSGHTRSRSGDSLKDLNGNGGLDPTSYRLGNGLSPHRLDGSEANLYLSSLSAARYQNHGSKSTSSMGDVEQSYLRMNSDERQSSSPSKFSLDERVLIEELLRRVIRRGSKPATSAQYGTHEEQIQEIEYGDNFTSSPSALATAVENGLVPIDPSTGFHSTQHLDCITSPQKYGFLPLNNSGEPYQEKREADAVSLFLSAPIFLDALLSIADDLMETPKSNRTDGLRRRLCELEVELLPSNVVYLPIGLMQHRVWRIVPDESIALSTNERVPCIVTLEIVDYGQSIHASGDSAVLAAWVNNPRAPKRHIPLIDKVATYTQEGLKMLDDRFSQHGDGKAGTLDRRFADFLQLSSNKKYSSVQTTEGKGMNNSNEEGSSDAGFELDALGPPPLGSPSSSLPDEEQGKLIPPLLLTSDDKDNTVEHTPALPTSPLEAPRTPTKADTTPDSPMGQWSTPKSSRKPSVKLRKRMNFIDEITEEDSVDNTTSPQGKQRKRVSFTSNVNSFQQSSLVSEDEANQSQPIGPVPTVVFKEDWRTKTKRLRKSSIYGTRDGWRLLPILIKSNDDLRQEQLAAQLIQRMALILAKANVPVWVKPYEIIALTGRGGSELFTTVSLLFMILLLTITFYIPLLYSSYRMCT